MAAAPEHHAYLVIQIQSRDPNYEESVTSLKRPASPEELKRLAGLVKDGAWGTARNPDFIRQLDHWELNLNAESESIRFRAWLLNTFASMGFKLNGVRSVSSETVEFYLERPRR